MNGVSVLTLVRNRDEHLRQLIEGMRRSAFQPDELIVVDMSDVPVTRPDANFPIRIERLETNGLPLAQARNVAAAEARSHYLVFLDVDCIPMRDCIGRLAEVIEADDAIACADIRYLAPDDACEGWQEGALLLSGRPHPVRSFPTEGVRRETNPGLFWSLGFAIRRDTFHAIGGFDETFRGYGAEDTDFGFRALRTGLPLLFVGGAIACHQHHASFDPPVQHFTDIVRNARRFYELWGKWPMEGWLTAFAEQGMIEWTDTKIDIRRLPTLAEIEAARVDV